jgi:hypothetical protein
MNLREEYVQVTYSNVKFRAVAHIFDAAFHYTEKLLTLLHIFIKEDRLIISKWVLLFS